MWPQWTRLSEDRNFEKASEDGEDTQQFMYSRGSTVQMAGKSQNQFVKTGMNKIETVGQGLYLQGEQWDPGGTDQGGLFQSLQLFSLLQQNVEEEWIVILKNVPLGQTEIVTHFSTTQDNLVAETQLQSVRARLWTWSPQVPTQSWTQTEHSHNWRCKFDRRHNDIRLRLTFSTEPF